MEKSLELERTIFDRNLEVWRKTHLGQFVLIKGDKVIGFFDQLDTGFRKGTELFGTDVFFLKRIMPADAVNVSFFGKNIRSA